MNTLGEWFRNAFPIDGTPKQTGYRPTEDIAADLMRNYVPSESETADFLRRQSQAKQPIFAPTRDEFAAWRDDSVTQFVFACLTEAAQECRNRWIAHSWGTGKADQELLTELYAQATAYEGMEAASYEDFCAWLGFEPEKAERAA